MPQTSEIINQFIQLLGIHRSVFGQERVFLQRVVLVIGELFAFKTRRITDLLRAMRLTDEDWSGWYRLFERSNRYAVEAANQKVFEQTLTRVGLDELYVIGGDCTQVWRDSLRLEGSSWELEVVHREVKSLFGLGDKQCFQPHAAIVSAQ